MKKTNTAYLKINQDHEGQDCELGHLVVNLSADFFIDSVDANVYDAVGRFIDVAVRNKAWGKYDD